MRTEISRSLHLRQPARWKSNSCLFKMPSIKEWPTISTFFFFLFCFLCFFYFILLRNCTFHKTLVQNATLESCESNNVAVQQFAEQNLFFIYFIYYLFIYLFILFHSIKTSQSVYFLPCGEAILLHVTLMFSVYMKKKNVGLFTNDSAGRQAHNAQYELCLSYSVTIWATYNKHKTLKHIVKR